MSSAENGGSNPPTLGDVLVAVTNLQVTFTARLDAHHKSLQEQILTCIRKSSPSGWISWQAYTAWIST